MKKQELFKEFFIRCFVYLIMVIVFFLILLCIDDQLPYFENTWWTIFVRCYTTAKFVFFTLIILIISSVFLALCHSFSEYWRTIKTIDKCYAFCFKTTYLIVVFILYILGTIPVFITAKAFNILYPNFWGALLTLLSANLVLLQVYPNIYNKIKNELSLTYLYGGMTGGITPHKTLLKSIALSILDTSKPAYLNLLGLSIFVEYQYLEAGTSFKGIAYELFSALHERHDWNNAFQACVGVIAIILIIDLLWTLLKIQIRDNK